MIVLTLLAILKPHVQLAYVARYYKQGKAKSIEQLYVCDFDGLHRQRLPVNGIPVEVHWDGANRLVWTANEGGATSYWTSALSPWHPRSITDPREGLFEKSRNAILPRGVVEEPLVEGEKRAPDLTLAKPDGQLPVSPYQTINLRGNKKTFTIEDELLHIWKTKDKSRLWILSGSSPTGFHEIDSLCLWEKGKDPRLLFTEAGQYDFREDRETFAYRSPFTTRPLEDGRRVWVTDLHSGNWVKGMEKTIVKGLVLVANVSVRPHK